MQPSHRQTPRVCHPRALVVHLMFQIFLASIPFQTAAEELASDREPDPSTQRSAFVYVIDKSSSMLRTFDGLKETLRKAFGKCGPDDSVSILVFGDTVTLLASYKSMNEFKKDAVLKLLDSVSADALYTNLGSAVDKGTQCLYDRFSEKQADDYTLVLVTDGKDHPSPNYVRERTIEDSITQFSDFLPGKQWSLRYIALEGQIDPQLLALVRKYDGSFFDVEKIAQLASMEDVEIIESIIGDPEQWENLQAFIIDHLGEVQVKREGEELWFSISKGTPQKIFPHDEVKVSSGSKAVISFEPIGRAGMEENSEASLESLQALPLRKSTAVDIRLDRGTLWNAVTASPGASLTYEVLTPIALTGLRGTVVRVAFDGARLNQSVAVLEGMAEIRSLEEEPVFEEFDLEFGYYSVISPGEKPSRPKPIPEEILREWEFWKEILRGEASLSQLTLGAREFLTAHLDKTKLVLGSLEPGKACTDKLTLRLEGHVPVEGIEIRAVPDISLPHGVSCSTSVNLSYPTKEAEIVVTAEVGEDVDLPDGKTWDGVLALGSPVETLFFSNNPIPLRLFREKEKEKIGSGAGRRSYYRGGSVWEWLMANWKWIALVIAIPAYFSFLILAERHRRYGVHIRKFIPPEGWLLVLNSPGDSDIENIDLKALSLKSKKSVLIVGGHPACDIRISHSTVDKSHAQLRSGREGAPAPVYIDGLGLNDVKVNDFVINKEVVLKDRDIVDIGAFKFMYTTSYLKQVVVHYNDGESRYGILLTWNIEDKGFVLRPVSEPPHDEPCYIPFSALKGVFFVKDFDEEIARSIRVSDIYTKKHHVAVEFPDGETIEGYTVQDYDPKAPRFYLVPELKKHEEGNNVYILVERSSAKKVSIVAEPA